jgi:hypothetical protein
MRGGFSAVGIDSLSISSLDIDDLKRLSISYGVLIIFIIQVNKQGQPLGLMKNIHNADIVIAVDGRKWNVEKSRYGNLVGGEV